MASIVKSALGQNAFGPTNLVQRIRKNLAKLSQIEYFHAMFCQTLRWLNSISPIVGWLDSVLLREGSLNSW